MAGLDCDVYRGHGPTVFKGFTDFCECFTQTQDDGSGMDLMIGCKGGCSAGSISSDGSGSDDASAGSDDDDDASAGSDDDDNAKACDTDDMDLCQTVCYSTDGQCGYGCRDLQIDTSALNIAGLDCDSYRSIAPQYLENFSDFCECFTHTGDDGSSFDTMIGCKEACSAGSGSDDDDGEGSGSGPSSGSDDDDGVGSGSGPSSGSDNTVLIVGIVVGAVVLIAIIIAVTICMRGKKL